MGEWFSILRVIIILSIPIMVIAAPIMIVIAKAEDRRLAEQERQEALEKLREANRKSQELQRERERRQAEIKRQQQQELTRILTEALKELEMIELKDFASTDTTINLRSSQAVDNYSVEKYFKDNRNMLGVIDTILKEKEAYRNKILDFIDSNTLKSSNMYCKLEDKLYNSIKNCYNYNIKILYISPAGRSTNSKILSIDRETLNDIKADPSLIMSRSEYNKYIKDRDQELLNKKRNYYYDTVNKIIDTVNEYKDQIIVGDDISILDHEIESLIDRTMHDIQKIKALDSGEWSILKGIINTTSDKVKVILDRNMQIINYYSSDEFNKIKETCNNLMGVQKEFNEYIDEKAQSLETLFGRKVIRKETSNNDKYDYIRQYHKEISSFTVEISAQVFASAENNPLEYVIKYFYPNKTHYTEQIQKLQVLIEELETLKEAKEIIEQYKAEYNKYLTDVPQFILDNDKDGFYSRLGFADIRESKLTVEYKFQYTSNGGMAQRQFTVPMTEDTITELIHKLQNKLTLSEFAKEQRSLMTNKLRKSIEERDNYTCRYCGNSVYNEPNLLLEIDHIIPIAKGGYTTEDNLQTLCWRCNRAKSDKLEE